MANTMPRTGEGIRAFRTLQFGKSVMIAYIMYYATCAILETYRMLTKSLWDDDPRRRYATLLDLLCDWIYNFTPPVLQSLLGWCLFVSTAQQCPTKLGLGYLVVTAVWGYYVLLEFAAYYIKFGEAWEFGYANQMQILAHHILLCWYTRIITQQVKILRMDDEQQCAKKPKQTRRRGGSN